MSPARLAIVCLLAMLWSVDPVVAGTIKLAGGVNATGLRLLDADGLRPPIFGPGVFVTGLDPSEGGIALGIDVSAQLASGSDALVSDLGASFISSWLFDRRSAAPFLSMGLTMVGASVDDHAVGKRGELHTRGLAVGAHGNIGVHGFTGDFYWRAQVGYLGAGVSGFRSQLCLGYVFERF
jgi:hypothetical protein